MNDNEVPGPFTVRQPTARDEYIAEAEMALNRALDSLPGLDANPVWIELLQHFARQYFPQECAE